MANLDEQQELVEYLRPQYDNLRVLDDGTIVATLELLYTRAIFIGLNRYGYEKRFCFKNRDLAMVELAKLKTGEDEPQSGTYVARR